MVILHYVTHYNPMNWWVTHALIEERAIFGIQAYSVTTFTNYLCDMKGNHAKEWHSNY